MEKTLYYIGRMLLQFNCMILIAEFLFLHKYPRRSHFIIRLIPVLAYTILFSSVFNDVLHLPFFSWYKSLFLNIPYFDIQYAIIYIVSVLCMWLCFDISFKHVIYYCTFAYVIQNFTFHLRVIVRAAIFKGDSSSWQYNISGAILMLVVYVAAYFLVKYRFRDKDDIPFDNGFVIAFVTGVIVVIGVFDIVSRNLMLATWALNVYAALVCVLLIMIQLGMFDRKKAVLEKEQIERLLATQAEQYSKQLANVDYINIKCHDLKHQIAVLKQEDNAVMRNELISESEKSIMIYENRVTTGNPVLDTLLTEKNFLCKKNNIRFSYIADGTAINAMHSTDICALFGNAIDNAVEYMSKNIEQSRRILTMQLERHSGTGSMIRVVFESSFDGELKLRDGIPETTKEDNRYHGLGLRSIRYIAQKYGGYMTVRAENGKFILSVIMAFD